MLSFNELEEVLLDIEQCLNNEPLRYNEEDPDCPVLTPNTLVFGAGKDKLERAIQYIFPLELSCNINRQIDAQLNVNAKEFRPKRFANEESS